MADLRQAAQELLRAWNAWQDSGAICADGRLLDALDALEQALAGDEPTTDELLRRLPHTRQCHLTYGTKWLAKLDGDLPLIFEFSADPISALRAALLQLPAPTEPPPEEP